MKVVLFCGGLGLRLYPSTEAYPKPLVPIGKKPLLWNLMKYYSYFGHRDFILCLGYKGEMIKKYLEKGDSLSNNLPPSAGIEQELPEKDNEGWKVTCLETGLYSNIGQRLSAAKMYVENEEMFLANYSDVITDLWLPKLIEFFIRSGKTGCLITVKPFYSYHEVLTASDGCVKQVRLPVRSGIRINGGFFVFKNKIFDYIKNGEDLVDGPFQRLIKNKELVAYRYNGFWDTMDTYKDKARLDDLASRGKAYWQIWTE